MAGLATTEQHQMHTEKSGSADPDSFRWCRSKPGGACVPIAYPQLIW